MADKCDVSFVANCQTQPSETVSDGDKMSGATQETDNTQSGSSFKIVSWNINGMRTLEMQQILQQLNCSVLCVQETKLARRQLDQSQIIPPGYSSYFSFSTNRIGYSGVATFCRQDCTPDKAEEGLCKFSFPLKEDDVGSQPELAEEEVSHVKYANADGRTVITQHVVKLPDGTTKPLTIINVYCPRLRDDPEEPASNNTDFKRTFHEVLNHRARLLVNSGSFVVLLGDINIAHRVIDQSDISDPKQFVTNQFRELLNEFVSEDGGFVDSFRSLHPDKKSAFTCWCTRLNARENNYGARIDYIFVDKMLEKYLEDADVLADVMGSDHCPISATFHSLRPVPRKHPPSFATKYYPEFSGKQTNLKDFFQNPVRSQPVELKKEASRSNEPTKKRPFENDLNCRGPNAKRVQTQTSLRNFFSTNKKEEESKSSCLPLSQQAKTEEPVDNSWGKNWANSSEASAAWKNLMKAPEVPLCDGHKEPCAKRAVKKKGANFGRQFWACPHGIGKSGDPNANCNFFQWVKSTK